ncbi:arsenate reductase [Rhodobacterales bacterium HKCCE4037]|nr:arsenate reductase [Rhodobacterales bacterium HKCCE4037]
MRIYGLKACDTCRKAAKALPAADFVDVRETPLEAGQVARFLDEFGEALVNRRSTTWRGLSEAEREKPPEVLLAAHPTLMKRPVIEADGALHLGWGKDVQAALRV